MNNKTYTIIAAADLDKVNFFEINESSPETVRKSIDESKVVIEYSAVPSFIADGTVNPISVLNHNEALDLMATEEWTEQMGE